MDLKQNYTSLAYDLESQELNSAGKCSDRVYAQLLAIYLLSNDLQNAKFLWKRIPDQTKSNSLDLKEIWKIGKLLLQHKSNEIYSIIDNYEWPNFLINIMKELKEEIKKRTLNLIQKSYSYISLNDLKRILNIQTDEELVAIISTMNWRLDGDDGVIVTKSQPVFESLASNQEHLEKMVQHVTFLEF